MQNPWAFRWSEWRYKKATRGCPCGYAGDPRKQCKCTPVAVERYKSRLSGPMRDRFDLSVDVRAVPWRELRATSPGESSQVVRTRVLAARARQHTRHGMLNARLEGPALKSSCALDAPAERMLAMAMGRQLLSARSATRVLRVARTIADLAGGAAIDAHDVAEALQFRVTA